MAITIIYRPCCTYGDWTHPILEGWCAPVRVVSSLCWHDIFGFWSSSLNEPLTAALMLNKSMNYYLFIILLLTFKHRTQPFIVDGQMRSSHHNRLSWACFCHMVYLHFSVSGFDNCTHSFKESSHFASEDTFSRYIKIDRLYQLLFSVAITDHV